MLLRRLATQLDPILDRAIDATGADFGNIQIVDRESGTLWIISHRGFRKPFLTFFRTVRPHNAACGTALENRARTVVGDVALSPLYTPAARKAMLAADAHACQSTPVTSDGEVVAIISTLFRTPHLPNPRELRRVDALAREAAGIIRHLGVIEDQAIEVRTIIEEMHEASDKTHIIHRK